jgi:hypothetical protein
MQKWRSARRHGAVVLRSHLGAKHLHVQPQGGRCLTNPGVIRIRPTMPNLHQIEQFPRHHRTDQRNLAFTPAFAPSRQADGISYRSSDQFGLPYRSD